MLNGQHAKRKVSLTCHMQISWRAPWNTTLPAIITKTKSSCWAHLALENVMSPNLVEISMSRPRNGAKWTKRANALGTVTTLNYKCGETNRSGVRGVSAFRSVVGRVIGRWTVCLPEKRSREAGAAELGVGQEAGGGRCASTLRCRHSRERTVQTWAHLCRPKHYTGSVTFNESDPFPTVVN